MKNQWQILFGFFVIAFVLLVLFDLPKQIKIDRCLDGGDRYNYKLNVCEHN